MDAGKKILLKTYWNGSQWFFTAPTEKEFALAKEQGYMFDFSPFPPHEESMKRLLALLEQITVQVVADAFLYSLTTRELEYRSALGSYWYGRAIPPHSSTCEKSCACGWCETDKMFGFQLSSRNLTNFNRYKWGQVNFGNLSAILFDLEQFSKLPRKKPSDRDFQVLRNILSAIKELSPSKKAGAYRDLLSKKKLFPANKQEIGVLLDILGICGVLSSREHPCPYISCKGAYGLPPREHTNDFRYPVSYWHAEDGVNEERFLDVFGFSYHDL